MIEYIEREAAINAVFEAFADGRSAYIALEAIPAADVRPVVLCRDCKHYRLDPIEIGQMVCVKDADEVDGYFSGFLSYPSEDWFCADGERREES